MQKSKIFFTCLSLTIFLPSVALSGDEIQDNKVHTTCVYLLKAQFAKAEKLLRNPQTFQEKGLYAALISGDSVQHRSFGFTIFDIDKAHILAKEALPHLQKDAKKNALSARILGSLYYGGTGVEKNIEKAFQYYSEAAEKGDPMAMNNVGAFYLDGIAVEKNKGKAIKWLRRAAGQGNTIAMRTLALLYMKGEIVKKDERKARIFCERAAKLGNCFGMYLNATLFVDGHLLEREKVQVRMNRQIEQAAESGFVPAMMHVAYFYENGFGCEQSDKKAFEWYKRAAESGLAEPLFLLAQCYRNGLGTQKNMQQARILLDEAEEAAKKQESQEVLEKLALLKEKDALLQNAELVLLNWGWHSEQGFATAKGEVKNVSEKPIHNVEAVVSFKTKAGKLITYDGSLIEFNPVMPGQISPFEVISDYNPQMKTAYITFKKLLGGTILWYTDSDNSEFLSPMDGIISILGRF